MVCRVRGKAAQRAMPDYRYEVRRGDEVVATGHLSHERPLQVGETLTIGSRPSLVRSIEPQLRDRELQLVLQQGSDLVGD
jgi:hypothetical protein